MKESIYNEIISLDNIQKAYFEVTEKLTVKGLNNSYSGVDNFKLDDSDFNIGEYLEIVREELLSKNELIPASCHEIPKRNGGNREVYIYSIKDRVKAQAISRMLEPLLEKVYSPFLFSYRSNYPSHLAARSAVRRYHRNFGKDHVIVIDLKQYSDNIDREILRSQLIELKLEKEVLNLIDLFLNQKIVKDKKIRLLKEGLVQGVPLVAQFANLYLNKIDWYVGKKVSFYRRVGDDLIIFDKDENKVKEIFNYLTPELNKLKLELSASKTKQIKNDQDFEYLGYLFSDNKIAISKSGESKIYTELRRVLRYYPSSEYKKIKLLSKKMFFGSEAIHYYLKNTVDHYRFVDDYKQVKRISEKIFHILTKYFFSTYSEKNRRLTNGLCKSLKIPSFYKLYSYYHNARNKK